MSRHDNDWFFESYLNVRENIERRMVTEFEEAFDKSLRNIGRGEEMENRRHGVSVTVDELRAGDLFYLPELGYSLFVCKGIHPIWAELQAVVWCNRQGQLTIDALSLHQHLHGVVVNRGEAHNERALRFRQWYIERRK